MHQLLPASPDVALLKKQEKSLHVDSLRATTGAERVERWLRAVYDDHPRVRQLALHQLRENPALLSGDVWVACAIGDIDSVRSAIATDSAWVNPAWPDASLSALYGAAESRTTSP